MQSFPEILPRLEMRLPSRRNIYDLSRPRIPRFGLGLRRFDFQDTEPPDFDAIPFDELLAHRREQTVDHGESGLLPGAGKFGYLMSQIFLGDRIQEHPSCRYVSP